MMNLGKYFQHLFPCGLPQFDVIDNPFCEAIKVRQLLYPTDVCMLNKRQFMCLKNYLMAIDEDMFAITDSFRLSNSFSNPFLLFPSDNYIIKDILIIVKCFYKKNKKYFAK